MTGRQPAGLPHSEICGSKDVCTSPQLIAAYHVFRRLPEPRHPPYALSYFRHTTLASFEEAVAYTFSFNFRYFLSFEFALTLKVLLIKELLFLFFCSNMSMIYLWMTGCSGLPGVTGENHNSGE